MNARLDKRQIRRAATRFAVADSPTGIPAERLAERVADLSLTPSLILDLGGDGTFIAQHYPAARVVAVDLAAARLAAFPSAWRLVGDAEQLPLGDAVADVVWSNFCLEWTVAASFYRQAARVLKPGGLLALTTLGPDTLKEIRAAFAGEARVHSFPDMHDLGDELLRYGFIEPVLESERLTLAYTTATAAMIDARNTGGGCALADRARGLLGKARWQRALREIAATGDCISVTYEVIYATAWRGDNRLQEARIDFY